MLIVVLWLFYYYLIDIFVLLVSVWLDLLHDHNRALVWWYWCYDVYGKFDTVL